MVLVLFTIILCAVSYTLNISAYLLYFSYLLGFTMLKSILSDKLIDVFNIRKFKVIYKEVGFLNSLYSFSSLLLITGYYVFNEYEHFSIEYMAPVVFYFILIYRFILWDITYKLNHLYAKQN